MSDIWRCCKCFAVVQTRYQLCSCGKSVSDRGAAAWFQPYTMPSTSPVSMATPPDSLEPTLLRLRAEFANVDDAIHEARLQEFATFGPLADFWKRVRLELEQPPKAKAGCGLVGRWPSGESF